MITVKERRDQRPVRAFQKNNVRVSFPVATGKTLLALVPILMATKQGVTITPMKVAANTPNRAPAVADIVQGPIWVVDRAQAARVVPNLMSKTSVKLIIVHGYQASLKTAVTSTPHQAV